MAEGLNEFFERPGGRPPLMAFDCSVITDGVSDSTDSVSVKERNGNKMHHNDCFWTPQIDDDGLVSYPSKGDRALVLISDEGKPWIIKWRANA